MVRYSWPGLGVTSPAPTGVVLRVSGLRVAGVTGAVDRW